MTGIRGQAKGNDKQMQNADESTSPDNGSQSSPPREEMLPPGNCNFGISAGVTLHFDYRHGLRQYSFSYRVTMLRPLAASAILELARLLWPSMPRADHAEESLQTTEQQLSLILALIQDRLEESGNYCSDPPHVNPQGEATFEVHQPCLRLRSGYRITAAIWRLFSVIAGGTWQQGNETLCKLLEPLIESEKEQAFKVSI